MAGAGAHALAPSCPVPQGAPGSERWAGQRVWQTLARDGFRIGKIEIEVENVFAPGEPAYQSWYAQAANAIHIKTRPGTVRSLLLFTSGDPVKPRVIYTTLRRLRAQTFVRAATITPASCSDDHKVAVRVRVKDAWTLEASASFSHVGGGTLFSVQVAQENFLGLGKKVKVGYTSNPRRSGYTFLYQDPAIAGSRWRMFAAYRALSDGYSKELDVGRPFHKNTDPWATELHYLDERTDLTFYNHARPAWRVSHRVRRFQWSAARLLSFSHDTGYRMGLALLYRDHDYGPLQSLRPRLLPAPTLRPRKFVGPAITWQMFQNKFASYKNLRRIGRTEDYNLGWNIGAYLGYYATALGSTASAWFGGLNASYGAQLPYATLVLFSASARGRHRHGEIRDLVTRVTATFYNQTFPLQTLVAHGRLNVRVHPDPESLLYLGGLGGLRGYPNFFLIGDRRWTAVFADRIVTPWEVGGLFRIGFVGYFEMGSVHRLRPSSWSRVYADVGLGLRVGNLKGSSSQVIYFTIAKPLVDARQVPGYQIVIGSVITF